MTTLSALRLVRAFPLRSAALKSPLQAVARTTPRCLSLHSVSGASHANKAPSFSTSSARAGGEEGVKEKEKEAPTFWTRMSKFLFSTGLSTQEKYDGLRMYERCNQHMDSPEFYTHCGVSEDFMGRVSLTLLHVWMCHVVMKENMDRDHKTLAFFLFEGLWEDTARRMGEEPDISPWLINKYLGQVQQTAMGGFLSYDKAIQIHDKSDDCDPFLGAIWRNLYEANLDVERGHLVQMRDYIFTELEHLRSLDDDVFLTGEFRFGPPPQAPPSLSEEASSLSESYAYTKMFDGEEQRTWVA